MSLIMIVEDEDKIAQILKKYLEAEGYSTLLIRDGAEVIEAAKENKPEMVLLDLMLPNKNGIDLCREIRQFSNVPIIMVTAKVEEIDRLLGLELGADDYICKPFSPREVAARVKATLRRLKSTAESVANESTINNGTSSPSGLNLDHAGYQAMLDGANLDLTPVEFRILCALTAMPIRVLRRNQLLDRMYEDYREVSDRTVDSHVANLRKKLKAIRPQSEHIQSVYGVGYRYVV